MKKVDLLVKGNIIAHVLIVVEIMLLVFLV